MKLEVFAYYPYKELIMTKKGSCMIGTMHIFIDDFGLDIRGIICLKNGNGKYKCYLPNRFIEDEQGIEVRVPFVSFTNKETNREILKAGQQYLKEYYAPIG